MHERYGAVSVEFDANNAKVMLSKQADGKIIKLRIDKERMRALWKGKETEFLSRACVDFLRFMPKSTQYHATLRILENVRRRCDVTDLRDTVKALNHAEREAIAIFISRDDPEFIINMRHFYTGISQFFLDAVVEYLFTNSQYGTTKHQPLPFETQKRMKYPSKITHAGNKTLEGV